MQQRGELDDAMAVADHVTGASAQPVGQACESGVEVLDRHVAQRAHTERLGSGAAGGPSVGIGAIGMRVRGIAVQDEDGQPGGIDNPLGARALYIFQNGRDTLYRIHGTPEPWTIGSNVSSGCVRLMNQDIMDLYSRVASGSTLIVG